jgi:hypothetical protein
MNENETVTLRGLCELLSYLVAQIVQNEEEWNEFKEDIWYDFKKDNNFNELKEAELMTNRFTLLQVVDPYVGRYYSKNWVRKNILQQTDEDIEEIDKEMEAEAAAMGPATDANGMPIDPNNAMAMGGQPQANPIQAAAVGGPPPMPAPALPAPTGKSSSAQPQQPMQEEEMPSKFELRPNELEFI